MKTIFPFLLLLGSSTAFAQWNLNPNQNNPVCVYQSEQGPPRIIADDNGGAYIAWQEQRKEDWPVAVYVQHISSNGQIQWSAGGVSVAEGGLNTLQCMVGDGAGGLIITWSNNEDIYAQRLSAGGIAQWTTGGVAVCTATGDQHSPQIVTDDKGGAFICWKDLRNGQDSGKAYVQYLDANGVPQWAQDGVAVSGAGAYEIAVAPDHAGGAIVTWSDLAGNIVAQRTGAGGTLLWSGGVLLCADPGIQLEPQIISDDSHGAVVVWTDWRYGLRKPSLYGQRVTATGTLLWEPSGTEIHRPVANYRAIVIYPQITRDGTGGVIAAWHDGRNGGLDDIYAQRLNGSGQKQWGISGMPVCTDPYQQYNLALTEDGFGGVVVGWMDYRNGTSGDIYAQQFTAAGNPVHAVNGIALCTAPNWQMNVQLVRTGRNNRVILTWDDRRNGFDMADIYATALSITVPGTGRYATMQNGAETIAEQGIRLSPNPAVHTLKLEHVRTGETVHLYDLYGRELRRIDAGAAELKLDVSDLVPGVYFIRTESENLRFIRQ